MRFLKGQTTYTWGLRAETPEPKRVIMTGEGGPTGYNLFYSTQRMDGEIGAKRPNGGSSLPCRAQGIRERVNICSLITLGGETKERVCPGPCPGLSLDLEKLPLPHERIEPRCAIDFLWLLRKKESSHCFQHIFSSCNIGKPRTSGLTAVFARHEIPDEFFEWRGFQLSSFEFRQFAVDSDFPQSTSRLVNLSPIEWHCSKVCSNHENLVKTLIDSGGDCHKAYQSTPLANGRF